MDAEAAPGSADENPVNRDGAGRTCATDGQAATPYHALPAKPALSASTTDEPAPDARVPSAERDTTDPGTRDHGPGQGLNATTLPPEILQHIFSFVEPTSLGRLLSVSRLFNTLLDPAKPLPSPSPGVMKTLKLQPQNDLWFNSKKLFLPASGLPRPMEDMSEVETWRLIRGTACHFCGRTPKNKIPLLATSPWNAGPGPEGVRAIWPFKTRSCGPCLEARIVKETEVLLSSQSILLPGLPFAVFTPSLNYVTSVTLRQTQPPPRLQLTKYYFHPQIEELDRRHSEVRTLGIAATQEWYKGLEARGKTLLADAARFEKWEQGSSPQVQLDAASAGQLSGSTSPALSMASSAMYSHQMSLQSPHRHFSAQNTPLHPGASATTSHLPVSSLPPMPLQNFSLAPGQSPHPDHHVGSPFPTQHIGSGPGLFQPPARPRQERSFQDIERMKADRRAEIERRCQSLNPSIPPSTLRYMDAFNAAMQIARPLDTNDWEVLKGRLLAQREEAEQKERETHAATRASQMEVEERQKFEEQRRQAQENADRIWNEIQKPSRDKAREYAEDYIKVNWADGRAVNKVSTGKFAAEVLQNVRRRFYEAITQEDTLLSSHAMTIPHDSPIHEIRRLKLEDMKWVYEDTIRPRTERFGREIFLCSTCEANAKRFTFDAVIQHYAAKHTSALSHGNAVVYWKADWPAEPPFHPNPDTVWNRPPEQRTFFPSYGATSPAYTPAYTPHPGASWMSPLAPGQPNGIYHVQCEELVVSAKRIWDATDQIRYLPDSLRLYVVIHQVALTFSRRFTNEPTLSMFADCIDHKPLLKPMKEVRGLTCKACHTFGDASMDTSVEFVLSDLLLHFQRAHVEYDATSPSGNPPQPIPMSNMSAPRLDWKFDMIDLPPEPIIRGLVHSPGMNQGKLEIIAEALPSYFAHPLPQIDPIPYTEEQYLPERLHLPGASGSGFGRDDPRLSFKRPLEDDPSSYPPPFRRVVEYDPYHPEVASLKRLPGNDIVGGYQPYVDHMPRERVVYVERSYPAREAYEHSAASAQPLRSLPRYAIREVVDEGSQQRTIHEVREDEPGVPRFREQPPRSVSPDAVLPHGEARGRTPSTMRDRDEAHSHTDAPSAAEIFLSNFDSIAAGPFEDGNEAGPSRFDAHSRLSNPGSRSHVPTPTRSRKGDDLPRNLGPESRRHSPPTSMSDRRSRNVTPIPNLDGGLRTSRREGFASHNEAAMLGNNHDLASPPLSHRRAEALDEWRQHPGRFEESGLPARGEGAVPYEYDQYADERMHVPLRPAYDRGRPSPEIRYRRYEERRPVRYIEVLPNGQRRVVEELPSPAFERIEYVSPPRREPQYMDRAPYYSDQRAPGGY